MSLLHRHETRAASLPEHIANDRANRARGGRSVTNLESAMRLAAVWACVNRLSDPVSTLPVHEYRREGQTRVQLDTPQILDSPSGEVDPINWRRGVMVSWLLRGNAFGGVAAVDRAGYPTQVELIHPDRGSISRRNGEPIFRIDGRERKRWPAGDLWHEPAFGFPGQVAGLSPISYAAETIGLGLSAADYGRDWFDNGAHPSATLSTDKPVGKDDAEIVKDRFKAATRNGDVAVVGLGLEYKAIQVSADESQFLDTIGANKADVAMFFGIQPEMIGAKSGDSMTYANVEQRSLNFLTYDLGHWLVKLEAALGRLRPPDRFIKFNPDAFVRVDLLTRYRAHDMSIRGGWHSADDVRALDDEPPLPNGEGGQYLWPPYATSPQAAAEPAPTPARSEDR